MDIQKMLRDAEALQKSLMQAQSELGNIEVIGKAGNDLVQIVMSAQGELKNIKIKKEVINPDDVETLEDLILSAFRDAMNKAESISKENMQKVTGNKNLPPMV